MPRILSHDAVTTKIRSSSLPTIRVAYSMRNGKIIRWQGGRRQGHAHRRGDDGRGRVRRCQARAWGNACRVPYLQCPQWRRLGGKPRGLLLADRRCWTWATAPTLRTASVRQSIGSFLYSIRLAAAHVHCARLDGEFAIENLRNGNRILPANLPATALRLKSAFPHARRG